LILAPGPASGSFTVDVLDSGTAGRLAEASLPVVLLTTEAYAREAMRGRAMEREGPIKREALRRAAIAVRSRPLWQQSKCRSISQVYCIDRLVAMPCLDCMEKKRLIFEDGSGVDDDLI
jgi:hypothetical protein